MKTMIENLDKWAVENPLLWQSITLTSVLILALIAYFVTHKYILKQIGKIIKKSKTKLDDLLFDDKLMRRISFLPPLLIIYNFGYLVPELEELIQRVSVALS